MNATALVETYAPGPVLVFGSLPPHNRDLDIVVRPSEQAVLERALASAGFVKHDVEWARFDGCSVALVDVVPIGHWDLSDEEADALFADVEPVDGFANLVQPSPHHSLLILARRIVRAGGVLDDKRRIRVRTALARDPDAWQKAHKHARAWKAERALLLLEATYKSGIPAANVKRVAALADRFVDDDVTTAVAYAKAARSARKRPGHHHVIAFSGLDGSGKSTQAEALRTTLEGLGYHAVVVWSRLSYNPSLNWIALPLGRLLSFGRQAGRSGSRNGRDPRLIVKEIRSSSPFFTKSWAAVVALVNGLTQRRIVRYHHRRGAIVICDRFVLDSYVHLRYRYGPEESLAWQKRIVQLVSPVPTRAYYIDVPPETALFRKSEQYDLAQLQSQSQLYRDEHTRLGVKKLDGLLPKETLCEAIARDVWSGLHARGAH